MTFLRATTLTTGATGSRRRTIDQHVGHAAEAFRMAHSNVNRLQRADFQAAVIVGCGRIRIRQNFQNTLSRLLELDALPWKCPW